MTKTFTFSDLSSVQQEHHEIAQSFDDEFSTSEFKERYLERFPDRNPSSILPSDFSFNNAQQGRDRYPSFLITVAPSRYQFVGLDYEYRDTGEYFCSLSRTDFDQVYENFNKNLRDYNGSEFEGFHAGVIHNWERYKDDIRRIALERLNSSDWSTSDIGTGRLLSALIHAIEIRESAEIHNNLVAWEPRPNQPSQTMQLRHDLGGGQKRNQFERVLFDLFKRETDHETSLTRLVELIGRRYSVVAYIFFLIDDTRYMPIAPQTFDRAFTKLGIDLRMSGKCSWENYIAYNEAISWVQNALIGWKGFANTRLLDAHSWIWLMARLPGKIEQQRKQGVSKPDDIKFKMIDLGSSILRRAATDNGQSEERVVKNKELFGFSSREALYDFLVRLWEQQQGLCNLTHLPMQLRVSKGTPNHMIVSVDRIDSDGHYSPDNLQLTCWFANRWKGITPNEEFIDLLSLIRTGVLEGDAAEPFFDSDADMPDRLLNDDNRQGRP